MPTFKDVEDMLRDKYKFVPSNRHHRYYELNLGGNIPKIVTKVSHSGRKPVPDSVLGKMATQLRVKSKYFREMLACDHKREEYYRQVREEPYPPYDIKPSRKGKK